MLDFVDHVVSEQVEPRKRFSGFKAGHDGDHQDARATEGKSPLQRSKLLSLGAAKSGGSGTPLKCFRWRKLFAEGIQIPLYWQIVTALQSLYKLLDSSLHVLVNLCKSRISGLVLTLHSMLSGEDHAKVAINCNVVAPGCSTCSYHGKRCKKGFFTNFAIKTRAGFLRMLFGES